MKIEKISMRIPGFGPMFADLNLEGIDLTIEELKEIVKVFEQLVEVMGSSYRPPPVRPI